MPQTNRKLDIKLIAPTAVFLGMLMILSTNICLSEPKTWENLVERKQPVFRKIQEYPLQWKN